MASEEDQETVEAKKKILLLKAEDPDSESDPYVDALKSSGMDATLIPVIKFTFENDMLLREYIKCHERASGFIFTSPRAVRAVKRILELHELDFEPWKDKINFALGHKTAMLAESSLGLEILGGRSANSVELATFIISCQELIEDPRLPFVFPCSQLAGDTLITMLQRRGLNVKRVYCYKLDLNLDLKDNFTSVVAEEGIPDIVVYFSPSGVESSFDLIKEFCGATQPKVVALGKTTAEAVKEREMELHKIAEYPNPDGVLKAVKSLL